MKRIIAADPSGIERAAQSILEGKIIAFPTETFYGLGARAFQVEAVQRIFAIKGREERNPILKSSMHLKKFSQRYNKKILFLRSASVSGFIKGLQDISKIA